MERHFLDRFLFSRMGMLMKFYELVILMQWWDHRVSSMLNAQTWRIGGTRMTAMQQCSSINSMICVNGSIRNNFASTPRIVPKTGQYE